jgi:hypothetical protein
MGQLLTFSLEDHLTECEQRYNTLLDRLDQTDRKLNRIEDLVLELKKLIQNQ